MAHCPLSLDGLGGVATGGTTLICLARRRCDVIHAMLRTGNHYLTTDQRTQRTQAAKAA
jgi:hypothetical protein